jgi:hypothetical protein
MRRVWIWAILLIALLLVAACRPVAELEETDSSSTEPTPAQPAGVCKPEEEECEDETADETVDETTGDETAVEETDEPASSPTEETASESAAEGETADPDDPFAVQKTDWVMGADEATVTIIEYGDYQ